MEKVVFGDLDLVVLLLDRDESTEIAFLANRLPSLSCATPPLRVIALFRPPAPLDASSLSIAGLLPRRVDLVAALRAPPRRRLARWPPLAADGRSPPVHRRLLLSSSLRRSPLLLLLSGSTITLDGRSSSPSVSSSPSCSFSCSSCCCCSCWLSRLFSVLSLWGVRSDLLGASSASTASANTAEDGSSSSSSSSSRDSRMFPDCCSFLVFLESSDAPARDDEDSTAAAADSSLSPPDDFDGFSYFGASS
mmetsp:Transcript_27884/g.54331  ORF Transcript_27884/g.54331 Transcript_27884/m.54331 type:complete len:249 (+) Transcript_27884:713-1459(+)